MAGKFGGTLADTIKPAEQLAPWEDFETRPELGEAKMYEAAMWDAYDNSSCHFEEARGISDAIRNMARNEPEENWNYETFCEKYGGDAYPKSQFNTYLRIMKEKGTILDDPSVKKGKGKDSDEPEIDERPAFDPDAEGADPLLIRLMKKKMAQAEAQTASIAETVEEKYYAIYEAAKRLANGRSLKHHVFICGDAGVGKSYMVEKAIDKGFAEWRPNKRNSEKPELINRHGSIGRSMTNILLFFYENRENKLILLDDADGFIETTDQDIQNFLKAILDPDMHPVTVSPTIRANANRIMQKEWEQLQKKLGESVDIAVDTSRLHEGMASVEVNGTTIDFPVTMEEARELYKAFPNAQLSRKLKEAVSPKHNRLVRKYNKLGELVTLNEADIISNNYDPDEEDGLSDEERQALMDLMGGDDEMLDTEAPEIPPTWQFKSSLMMISNLLLDNVNEAVRSRCQCVELTLTRPEFLYRCESIIDKINVGDDSSNDPAVIEWAKKETFAIFKSIVGATEMQGTGFDDIRINIPLEFRLVATLTGDWLARYDRWCEAKGISDGENSKYWKDAEEDLMLPFIKYGLTPILAGNTRSKKKKAK